MLPAIPPVVALVMTVFAVSVIIMVILPVSTTMVIPVEAITTSP